MYILATKTHKPPENVIDSDMELFLGTSVRYPLIHPLTFLFDIFHKGKPRIFRGITKDQCTKILTHSNLSFTPLGCFSF